MKIKTNNKPRDVIYGFQLSDKERAEFDYYAEQGLCDARFFRYKGQLYDLGEFQITAGDLKAQGWQRYASDSYFSGVVVKYRNDYESVIVGNYFC